MTSPVAAGAAAEGGFPAGARSRQPARAPDRTQTIAFGDPSYDRQLGSTAEGDIKQVGAARALLSVDREEYDPGATLYFACDDIDPVSGLFSRPMPARTYVLRFRRLGKPNPDGTSRVPNDLVVAGMPLASGAVGYELEQGKPYEVPLQLLRYVRNDAANVSPLEPGDRLEVSASVTDAPDRSGPSRCSSTSSPRP